MTHLRLPVVADLDTLSSLMLTAALEEAEFQVLNQADRDDHGWSHTLFQA